MASIWSGMKSVAVSGRGNFLPPGGHFDVQIDRCMAFETREKGLAFIAEFKVLTSTHADVQPGSSGAWYQSLRANIRETAFSNIKGLITSALGLDSRKDAERIKTELDPEIETFMDLVTGEENALCEKIVHVETFLKKTKEDNDFTVHIFTPYQEAAK